MPYFDPMTGEFVYDDVVGPVNPGALGSPAPVYNPGVPMQPPVAPPPPEPTVTSAPGQPSPGTSSSASVENTSFNLRKGREVDSYLDPKAKGDEGRIGRQYSASQRKQEGLVRDAAQVGVEAQQDVNKATEDLYSARGMGEAKLATMQDQMNTEYATAVATARTGTEAARARYMAQMQRVGAMGVDPGRLMKNAGFGGRLGLGLAAFAEGFLGAKGIRISAIQNIKDAIQQDIDAQLTDIAQGNKVTEGFRTLYDMAREEAADDLGVRERLMGFYLESAKHSIAADTLKYEGKLASAQGEQAIAAIIQEQAKSLMQIEQSTMAGYQKAIDDAHRYRLGQAGLAIERQKVAAAARANELEAGRQAMERARETGIVNTETGELLGFSRDQASRQKIQERTDAAYSAARNAKETIDLMHEVGDVSTLKVVLGKIVDGRPLSTSEQKLATKMKDMVVSIAIANNPEGRISDKDVEFANQMAVWNESLRAADTTDAIAELFVSKVNTTKDALRGQTIPLSGENRGNTEGADSFAKGIDTILGDYASGKHREPALRTEIQNLTSDVRDATRLNAASENSPDLAAFERETNRDVAAWSGGESGGVPFPDATPQWAARIDTLAQLAQGLDVGKDAGEGQLSTRYRPTQEDKVRARESLELLSNDNSIPDDIRAYANWKLGRIK